MSLSQRLKLLINSKKISQSEFARMLEVTRGSVNQWLAGKLVPGHKPLMKIFEMYPDISADWLLLGRGDMLLENKSSGSDNSNLQKQLLDQAEMMGLYKKLIDEKDARIRLLETLISSSSMNSAKGNK